MSQSISEGWELARSASGECEDPGELHRLSWRSGVEVPGTVAGALGPDARDDLDESDWWYRVHFPAAPPQAGEEIVLALDGIATVAEVYLNGERVLESDSMFAAHELDIGGRVSERNELVICCRALAPLLAASRKPRQRWRTRLVSHANLRFHRTMLLGRAPGFAPGPAVVGLWRPVRLARRRGPVLDRVRLRSRLDGEDGALEVEARLRPLAGDRVPGSVRLECEGHGARESVELSLAADPGGVTARGSLKLAHPRRWWPHTHGSPDRYAVKLVVGEQLELVLPQVGFRSLELGGELEHDGLALRCNGTDVFARGAVWTPLSLSNPHSTRAELLPVLTRVVQSGMNMLRIPGTACYESDAFYELCDELGLLVWQDFMFANLDYPEAAPEFMATVEAEARDLLTRLGARPSLAVLCGGSEVAQQVAMAGLDPELANGPLFGELLPSLVAEAAIDAPYIPSAPWGGELPFRPGRGIANYYGVGAYLRGLDDVRRSEVRFAAECLAFANVPDLLPDGVRPGDSAWKAGVPRDVGAGWDFDDVRDHYLQRSFDVDPVHLRSFDPERFLELSRAVSGELMAEVFGEWRRGGSPCHGALVLWLKDLLPGAGWGVLDDRGAPKVAYHHLRRALAPVAVWSTDEGLSGIDIHVANDRPESLEATLRVALYRELETLVEQCERPLALPAHGAETINLEALLGRFVDVSYAYRFGPPGQDLVAVSLESDASGLLSQAFRLPVGRPRARETAERLGVNATVANGVLSVSTRRFLYGVRVQVPGYVPEDDAFSVEPGHAREVRLHHTDDGSTSDGGGAGITTLNMVGRMPVQFVQR